MLVVITGSLVILTPSNDGGSLICLKSQYPGVMQNKLEQWNPSKMFCKLKNTSSLVHNTCAQKKSTSCNLTDKPF